MAERLPRLRMNLEFMPSPVKDRPGLLIRDPFQYSDATLIIPPVLVECLQWFDGEHTDLDLRAHLVRLTGDLRIGDLQEHFIRSLREAAFLEDEQFQALRERRHRLFAESPRREATHAGSAYPSDPAALRGTLSEWIDGAPAPTLEGLVGLVAPHVSPEGGWRCYGTAYGSLGAEYQDRVFVILGTSHLGEPERFGLTVKDFVTPLGEARTERALVESLADRAGPAVKLEDYCHAIEHSIEFQVVFLQHLYGAQVRLVPILCGAFARSIQEGGRPEDDEAVRRFLEALAEMAAREGQRLFWVLGVDLAHMGQRYGDPFPARAGADEMRLVEEGDRRRIERLEAADAPGFWEAIQDDRDPLKWCGASAFYAFLRAVPEARGKLLRYEQWNIDAASVVSFAAMGFSA
jgi:AmmeMemoRadiSam system protein B